MPPPVKVIEGENPKTMLAAIKNSFLNHKLGYVSSFGLSVLQAGVNLAAPYLLINMVDEFEKENEDGTAGNPLPWLAGYCACLLVSKTITTLREEILTPIGTDFSNDTSQRVLAKYYAIPMQSQLSTASTPTVNDFGAAYERAPRAFVNTLHGKIVPASIEMVAACAFISTQFGYAGGVITGGLLAHILGLSLGAQKVVDAQNTYIKNLYGAFDHVIGQLSQYSNVNIYSAARYEIEIFARLLAKLDEMVDKSILIKSRALLLQSGLVHSVTVMGIGSLALYSNNALSSEDLLWVLIYLSTLAPNFEQLSASVNTVLAEKQFLSQIIEHLNEPDDSNTNAFPSLEVNTHNSSIAFENIQLRYIGAQGKVSTALHDVSLTIPAGKVVILTGESGSGKTSLFNLLQKFLPPTAGNIKVADTDIHTCNTKSVRDAFSVVPQSTTLLNASLRENVRYANRDATDGEIDEALTKAGLAALLVEKGDAALGQNGGQASGGQRQRIGIARAYVRNSPILILDEPTSALDAKTEKEIFTALNDLVKNKKTTTFIITHRLSALDFLENIHQIVVLKRGRIIEQGTKEELLRNKDGLFYQQMQVVRAQQALERVNDAVVIDATPALVLTSNPDFATNTGNINDDDDENNANRLSSVLEPLMAGNGSSSSSSSSSNSNQKRQKK
jgi:ABC-type multidrug transport system fused ATPase/permease subunit